MTTTTLKAHYDGKYIVLDEPFELTANTALTVTVFVPDNEREEWANLSAQSLARAYGDNEPEYTLDDLKL
jgi:hypothetical protein